MEKKYYYYDVNGNEIDSSSVRIRVVSEVPLPRFSIQEKHLGKCSLNSRNIPQDTPLNKTIRVAFGDPRIFDCKIKSFSLVKSPAGLKEHFANCNFDAITLEYKGKRIWASQKHLCLEKDLI